VSSYPAVVVQHDDLPMDVTRRENIDFPSEERMDLADEDFSALTALLFFFFFFFFFFILGEGWGVIL
jgi:hypothetical protein